MIKDFLEKQGFSLPIVDGTQTGTAVQQQQQQQQSVGLPQLNKEQIEKALTKAGSFLKRIIENAQRNAAQTAANKAASSTTEAPATTTSVKSGA
jgi:hypothetical protein